MLQTDGGFKFDESDLQSPLVSFERNPSASAFLLGPNQSTNFLSLNKNASFLGAPSPFSFNRGESSAFQSAFKQTGGEKGVNSD